MQSGLLLFYEKADFRSTLNLIEYTERLRPYGLIYKTWPVSFLALKFEEGHFEWLRVRVFQCQSVGVDPGIHCKMFFCYQSVQSSQ